MKSIKQVAIIAIGIALGLILFIFLILAEAHREGMIN